MDLEKKTILIADDSPTMRVMLEDIIASGGFRLLIAEDGIQAAMMAFEHNPDLIISDIEMPRMDGYQVCRLLKSDPATAHIPVIILTSKDSSGSVYWGYQTGADLYILKSFKPEELLTSINELLERYRDKNIQNKSQPRQTVDAFKLMEKLNSLMDNRLFEMTIINEINQTTVNLTSVSETITSLLDILDKAIDNHILGFVIFTDEREILLSVKLNKAITPRTLEIFQFMSLEDLSITINKDISDYAIEVEILGDTHLADDSAKDQGLDPQLIYSIPIRAKEELYGILNVYHPQMQSVSLYQKQLLDKLAPYLSTSIGAITMHNRIKGLSVIDGLTQLYNRRYIMELFKKEFSKTIRYQSHLSLLMIDIDDFKRINDTHGHLSGDLVLKKLSTIIRANLRSVDLPGRYGGEEFIIILPETDKANAFSVGERIRARVQDQRFKTMNGEPITVTVSLGLSDIHDLDNKTNELELIKAADSRLYKAKRSGKNKVISE